uniref:Uncharacterized protein n=1 Tax=viral metagenome TaxID=1070528 RepID=A0A6M3XLW4_9ZZZZ
MINTDRVLEYLGKIAKESIAAHKLTTILEVQIRAGLSIYPAMDRLDTVVEELRTHKEALWNLLGDEEEVEE